MNFRNFQRYKYSPDTREIEPGQARQELLQTICSSSTRGCNSTKSSRTSSLSIPKAFQRSFHTIIANSSGMPEHNSLNQFLRAAIELWMSDKNALACSFSFGMRSLAAHRMPPEQSCKAHAVATKNWVRSAMYLFGPSA